MFFPPPPHNASWKDHEVFKELCKNCRRECRGSARGRSQARGSADAGGARAGGSAPILTFFWTLSLRPPLQHPPRGRSQSRDRAGLRELVSFWLGSCWREKRRTVSMLASKSQVRTVLYSWWFQRAPSLAEPPGYRELCVWYEPEANICSTTYHRVNNRASKVYVCREFSCRGGWKPAGFPEYPQRLALGFSKPMRLERAGYRAHRFQTPASVLLPESLFPDSSSSHFTRRTS